jgi:hypothetical protein
MNDHELRALVRDAVARHLGRGPQPSEPLPMVSAVAPAQARGERPWLQHHSHGQYLAVINTGDACVIEPSVNCDHCGYCKSHGH